MKDRISKILREEGMTATKFAEEIEVQASSISHIISGRNNPSTDFVVKLLERFRGINAEWLLTGKGEMYKNSNTDRSDDNVIYTGKNTLFSDPPTNSENKSSISPSPTIQTIIENEPAKLQETAITEDNTISSSINTPSKEEKTVEKIVVFFTDKTFESYNPHK